MNRLAIIYVLYDTDIDLFHKSVRSLEESISENLDVHFFIYNNSVEDIRQNLMLKEKFEYFHDKMNIGLAKAQNKIIRGNLTRFNYFLTSDQDSIYSSNFLDMGIDFLENNNDCGCVVPIWRNILSKDKKYRSQLVLKKGGLRLIDPYDVEEDYFRVTHAICSGSIIRASMFHKIGLFNEHFFIDWIDNEWMWRGHKFGLNVVCNKNLRIDHQWGNIPLKFSNIEIPNKSALRVYFTFRNGLALLFKNDLEFYFKKYLMRQLAKSLCYVLISFDLDKYRNLFKAILDYKQVNVRDFRG